MYRLGLIKVVVGQYPSILLCCTIPGFEVACCSLTSGMKKTDQRHFSLLSPTEQGTAKRPHYSKRIVIVQAMNRFLERSRAYTQQHTQAPAKIHGHTSGAVVRSSTTGCARGGPCVKSGGSVSQSCWQQGGRYTHTNTQVQAQKTQRCTFRDKVCFDVHMTESYLRHRFEVYYKEAVQL